LSGEGVEIWCDGSPGGARIGAEERDRPPVIDFGRDREGESAVSIPENASGNVRECGRDQGRLRVFSGRGTGA